MGTFRLSILRIVFQAKTYTSSWNFSRTGNVVKYFPNTAWFGEVL